MTFEYVIDTYAWVEYFAATRAGKIAREYIEGGFGATPTIVFAELKRKLLREIEKGNETREGMSRRLEFIEISTAIEGLDIGTASESAEIDVHMKSKVKGWGMADSVILATARLNNAKVVTGDNHFRGLPDAIMIK